MKDKQQSRGRFFKTITNPCEPILSKFYLITFLTLFTLTFSIYSYARINILAAENIYGEVAKELGGNHVNVISILNNPFQDPHSFTITPSMLKAAYQADIIIYNGADYDPWISKLIAIKGVKERRVINISALIQLKPNANPHIWYMPETMPRFAKKLVALLIEIDPENKDYYQAQLQQFNQSYQTIFNTIKHLRERFQGTPVIATESVFEYMGDALGLDMHGIGFQTKMMNDLPPSVSEIKSFEDDLHQHSVFLLIYNNQVVNPIVLQMRNIARKEKIPELGISEMLEPGTKYITWMMQTLNKLEEILDKEKKANNERAY